MAAYKFTPPEGYIVVDVLARAHQLRVFDGDYAIQDVHLADAIAKLSERRSLRSLPEKP